MVEFQAPRGAARGRLFLPRAGDEKYVLPTHQSILAALDFLVIFTLPAFGSLPCQTTENLAKNLCFWSLLALISVLLTASHGGYRPQAEEQPKNRYGISANCFLATTVGMLILAIILGHPNILARHWVVLNIAGTPFCLICIRTVAEPKLRKFFRRHTTPGPFVVCYDTCPQDLHKALASENISDQVKGVLYLSTPQATGGPSHWPELPDAGALRAKLLSTPTRDIIFIHHPALDRREPSMNLALWEMVLTYPARIWLAFDVASSLPEILREKYGEYRLVPIVTNRFLTANNILKRIFDIIAASLSLALASPLLIICASLIRATSPGPIIFRQLRTGTYGHQFQLMKFRTMTHEPERAFAQACRHDPRVTGIGRWLRRLSLDELPQLLNVIRGDMSLVGPRPHAPETQVEGMSFEHALKLYQIRHRVKPGMTGLAQVRGLRGATPVLKNLEQRLASDLEYIQSWSIWLDISILLQTLPAVFMQTNAW